MPSSALHALSSLQDAKRELLRFMRHGWKKHTITKSEPTWTCTKGVWCFLKVHLCAWPGGALAIPLQAADARTIGPLLSKR